MYTIPLERRRLAPLRKNLSPTGCSSSLPPLPAMQEYTYAAAAAAGLSCLVQGCVAIFLCKSRHPATTAAGRGYGGFLAGSGMLWVLGALLDSGLVCTAPDSCYWPVLRSMPLCYAVRYWLLGVLGFGGWLSAHVAQLYRISQAYQVQLLASYPFWGDFLPRFIKWLIVGVAGEVMMAVSTPRELYLTAAPNTCGISPTYFDIFVLAAMIQVAFAVHTGCQAATRLGNTAVIHTAVAVVLAALVYSLAVVLELIPASAQDVQEAGLLSSVSGSSAASQDLPVAMLPIPRVVKVCAVSLVTMTGILLTHAKAMQLACCSRDAASADAPSSSSKLPRTSMKQDARRESVLNPVAGPTPGQMPAVPPSSVIGSAGASSDAASPAAAGLPTLPGAGSSSLL